MNQSSEANIDNTEMASSNTTLGELFKQTRLKRNLTLDDVCQQINLRPSLLTQLENNDFIGSNIPVTFMKGYIRSYAKFLQLPESCYTEVFNSLSDGTKNDLGKNRRIMKYVNHHNAHNHRVGYFSLLVILILLVVTGLWWWQSYQQTETDRNNLVENYVDKPVNQNLPNNLILDVDATKTSTPATTEETNKSQESLPLTSTQKDNNVLDNNANSQNETKPTENVENTESTENSENQNIKGKPLTSGAILEQAMLDAKTDNGDNKVTKETTKETTTAMPNNAVLQIKVKGDCWLSVKDSKHKVLAQKLYKAGEKLDFYENSPYFLVIGSPKNVDITYKGKAYSLNINGKVAKVKLS